MAQQRFGSHMPALRFLFFGLTILFAALAPCSLSADEGFAGAVRWRNVGPFRGGRTRAIAGVPSQPNVFYMAQVNGGVFKTIDYGRTWQPIFDDQPTGSVGAIAVSVSNPEIVYVGSGEGLHRPDLSIGDGIYKSTDAGKTWTHLGLRDGQQVAQLAVDPRNPDRFFVAVAGHPYGPNEEREFSARSMAVKHSRRFSTATKTPEVVTSRSIRPIRPSSMRLFGNHEKGPGKIALGMALMAASSNQRTAAKLGTNYARAFPRKLSRRTSRSRRVRRRHCSLLLSP